MIKIVDNFLSESYFKKIEEIAISSSIEWVFSDNITDNHKSQLGHLGFCYPICTDGELVRSHFAFMMTGFLYQVMDLIGCKNIIRSRIDMTLYNPNNLIHLPHVDFEDPYIKNTTTIFYITDNVDSETIIFDNKIKSKDDKNNLDLSKLKICKKIQPRKNRLVIFDGSYLHTGHSPIHENRRILINSNFN